MISSSPEMDLSRFDQAPQLAVALADLARSSAQGTDVVDVLSTLATRCVGLLPVAAAGILVLGPNGALRVIGSSSDAAHLLDLYQVQNEEGPCLDCFRTHLAVSVDDLTEDPTRWPRFQREALNAGFTSVYALPLDAQGQTIGAINLFATARLSAQHLVVAQAMADAATLTLLHADPVEDAVVLTRRLHDAIEARNTVEQAKGMLAQRFSERPEEAFVRLVRAAQDAELGITDAARLITRREEPAELSAALSQA